MNVPLVLPAAIVRVAGTVADLLLDPSNRVTPPFGAGPVRVTVAVELEPPVTVVGLSVRVLSVGAKMASWAV